MARIDWDRISEVHSSVREERFEREQRERQARMERELAARAAADAARRAEPPRVVPGTKIWRSVQRHWRSAGVEVKIDAYVGDSILRAYDTHRVVLSEDSQHRPVGILRASYGGRDVKAPIWYAIDGRATGMIVFIYDDIPGDWTYLHVVSVGGKATSCIARPIVGKREELLAQYTE
jgi:hypothetical protein